MSRPMLSISFTDYRLRFMISVSIVIVAMVAGCQPVHLPPEGGPLDDHTLFVHSVDPLEKVLRETARFMPHEAVADVARGEHASLQFVVRATGPITDLRMAVRAPVSGQDTLSASKTGFIGYVRVGRSTPNPSRDRLLPASGYYPDPILELPSMDVEPHLSQPCGSVCRYRQIIRRGGIQGLWCFPVL